MVNMRCPQCGAELSVENGITSAFCKYCGHEMVQDTSDVNVTQDVNINQTVNVVHTIDRSNEPNLYINFMSVNPKIMLVTRIVETGQKNTYISGQTMTFRLSPGRHVVVLKIGKRNYNRTIFIPENNQPVRINASFSGVANINIDQPEYVATANIGKKDNMQRTNNVQQNEMPPKPPMSGWAILAFVLSLLYYTSPVAVILGVLDLTIWKKKEKAHGLAIAAIAVGACLSIVLFSNIASCASSLADAAYLRSLYY